MKYLLFSILLFIAKADEDHHQSFTSAHSWGYGILSGLGIVAIGFLAAILVISLRKCISNETFKVIRLLLSAIGCGAVLGDAFVHILPSTFGNAEVNSNIAAFIIIAAITFLIFMDRIFSKCGVSHEMEELEDEEKSGQKNENKKVQNESFDQINNAETSGVKTKEIKAQGTTSQGDTEACCGMKGKGSSGYMMIISELIHLLLSGVGLGVAFGKGDKDQFVPLLIAVYAHEIPCAIGCVGIFLKSGFTNCQCIVVSTLINTAGFLGTIIGVAAGKTSDVAFAYIMCFVAGNFLYIGGSLWKTMFKQSTFVLNLFEFLAFSLGIGAMYLVLFAESGSSHNH